MMMTIKERPKQPLENMTSPDHGQETATEEIWPYVKIFGLSETILQSNVKGKRRIGRIDRGLPAQLEQLKTGPDERDTCNCWPFLEP